MGDKYFETIMRGVPYPGSATPAQRLAFRDDLLRRARKVQPVSGLPPISMRREWPMCRCCCRPAELRATRPAWGHSVLSVVLSCPDATMELF